MKMEQKESEREGEELFSTSSEGEKNILVGGGCTDKGV